MATWRRWRAAGGPISSASCCGWARGCPFLFIAGRLYGADELGRFAYALVAVELCGMLGSLGLKRGLAHRLSREGEHPANVVADALLASLLAGLVLALALRLFPLPMFPHGEYGPIHLLLPLAIAPLAVTEVALAALAYRFDVTTTVKARAVVEPWTLSLAAAGCGSSLPDGGMELAFILSILAAALTALTRW
jgi:O-antigen/teichoic acid export membrane protein